MLGFSYVLRIWTLHFRCVCVCVCVCVLRWCHTATTWNAILKSVWMHPVTFGVSMELVPFWCQREEISFLLDYCTWRHTVIVHTRLFACNMASLSPELIYLNPSAFLMCFDLPRPSVSLLHLVAFYCAKLTVLIAKTRCRVCCVVLCCVVAYRTVL